MNRRVFAMARPRRPASEREALFAAAGESGSARARAARVARQVVAYLAAADGEDPSDVPALARRLAAQLSPTPIDTLATSADADTAALIRSRRLAAFEARECHQLGPDAWAAETRKIMREVEAILSRRYARLLR